jgi:HD domain
MAPMHSCRGCRYSEENTSAVIFLGRGKRVRGAGLKVSSRALVVVPFLLGGLAGAWLVVSATEPLLLVVGWIGAVLSAAAIVLISIVAPARGAGGARPDDPGASSERWEPRHLSSWLVRAVAVSAPLAVSVTGSVALQALLPTPDGLAQTLGHVLLLLACGMALVYPAERATRRLAPIAMLLRLSLVFPNAAPSRFRVARDSSDPQALQRELDEGSISAKRGESDAAGMLLSLLAALTAHDTRTRGHSERVRVFSEMLGDELGVPEAGRERLRWAALLHDIGKLGVSAEVLNHPGELDEAQWKVVHGHPAFGAKLVAPLALWLGEWHAAVEQHHERFDGGGYPHGLAGQDISLGARIIAVADSFDTMVTPRSYRAAMAPEAARREVALHASTQFDPVVVRALLNLSIPRLWWRIGIAGWTAQLPLLRWTRALPARWTPSTPDLVALGLAATTFLAGSAGVTLLESHPAQGPRGDRLLSQGVETETVTAGTVIAAGSAEGTKASTERQEGGGRKDGRGHGANGGGNQAGDGAPGGSPNGGSGNGGSGNGGSGQAQPPSGAGDANPEPGKSGDGGASGHDTRVEDGKGLPAGQIVADDTPEKGGGDKPGGQIVADDPSVTTNPAGHIPGGNPGGKNG